MEVPLEGDAARAVGGILAPDQAKLDRGLSGGRGRKAPLLTKAIDELNQLAQPVEVEQVGGAGGRKGGRGSLRIVRIAEGDGGVAAIGQPDDDVRAFATADADDGQLLSEEGMVRMRDGHASRRGLGQRRSAL